MVFFFRSEPVNYLNRLIKTPPFHHIGDFATVVKVPTLTLQHGKTSANKLVPEYVHGCMPNQLSWGRNFLNN